LSGQSGFGSIFARWRGRFYLPGNAWVLAVSATVWNVGGAMVNPYQSIFFSAVGASSVFIGYLLAMNSGVTALMQLVGGYVADAWGRRKVIAVFSFLSAVSAFVFIFISQDVLLILPILLGAIAGIYGPAFNATLTDSMEPELRARGLVSFTLVTSLPSVFFPYVGGLLMQTFGTVEGLRIAFFMSGLLGVLGVSFRAARLKETFMGSEIKSPKGTLQLIADFFRQNSYVLRNASDGAKKLLIYSALASAGTGMTVPYTSLYLVNVLALPPEFYGVLTNVAGVISVLLLLPAARIIERVGLRRSAIYASVSVPVNQLIFVRAKGTDDFVTWTSIGGASGALLGPSLTALQANHSPQEVRGRIMALFSVFALITAIPAQIVGGYLYVTIGPLSPFIASVPIFLLATFTLVRIREPKPRPLPANQNHA
jgi:DHA1 family tetracycline resistance protein-like MFS transporter